jgi:Cu+-exporting ATPase
MAVTKEQVQRIEKCFPLWRQNRKKRVTISMSMIFAAWDAKRYIRFCRMEGMQQYYRYNQHPGKSNKEKQAGFFILG